MEKPTSVTVLGIIGIILAGMGILGGIAMLVMSFMHISFATDPVAKAMDADAIYVWTNRISVMVGIPITVLLLAASIGSLTLARWARKGMLTYGWLAMVQLSMGAVFTGGYVLPKMHALMMPQGEQVALWAMVGGIIGGGCASLFGAVYPVFVLVLFRRRNVVDAFNGVMPAERANFQVVQGDQGQPPASPFY